MTPVSAASGRAPSRTVDKLGKLLPSVLARQPNQRQIGDVRVRMALGEMLGEEMVRACEEVELRGSTLWISTSNPALAHALQSDSEPLLARLNQFALPRPVRTLKVRSGRRARS